MWAQVLGRCENARWSGADSGHGIAPDLILFFASTSAVADNSVGNELAATFPDALRVGCSTGTVVDNAALRDNGAVAMALGFDNTRLRLAMRQLANPAGSEAVGAAIGAELAASDLAGVLVLSNGLRINGSALVKGIISAVGTDVSISGGLAGDGPSFSQTMVSVNGAVSENAVVAIGLYGSSIRLSHGSAGGWDEFGPKRTITRSEDNVLFELDGTPALDLYERYLGEEAADLPASGLFYPLKVWDPAHPGDGVVRTLLSVDRPARSLTFAGDVPAGWSARLMRGSIYRLTDGASAAARNALASLRAAGATPQACLFVSCVGRRLLMQQRTEDEVEAVIDVLGKSTPVAGFYSYGEIAPNDVTRSCGLHNQTATLTLLAEV